MPEIFLTQTHQNATIRAHAGDAIHISLPETPTSGCRWAVDGDLGGALASAGSDFRPAGGGIGAGGTRVLSFRAVATGVVLLRLKRWQEWEGEPSVDARFSVSIAVG